MERQAYTYDAWGNHTVTWHNSYSTNFNASYNPFRYRGYFYDTDTGLYYLQSRYYNPQWGRFLNVDAYISTGTGLLGYNMYAYCGNNPVIRIDSGGRMWELVPALNPRNHVFTFGEGMGGGAAGSIQTRLTPSYSESSAYRTWSVRSRTAAYDASLGGYCAGGGGSSYGSSGQYSVPGAVTVTDDMAVNTTKGWKVGDNITNLTKNGNRPSWTTVHARYWKNQAHYHPELYSDTDLALMRQGRAPKVNGQPLHLHHPYGREGANFWIFYPVTYEQHHFIHYGW